MPYQLPLTYRQIEDQYNKARSSGLFSEGSLQDYAKVGDQFYPGKYQAVSDRSWLGVKMKGLSTGIDRALESSGAPQAVGDLTKWAFDKFGGTPEVGQQVGETLPRAAGAMVAGPAIGGALGGIVGGIGGAFAGGVGAVPGAVAGAETGASMGSAITAFLFGLDAYEKSDSLKQAAFAAAIPAIAGKFSQLGMNTAMKVLPKIPGAQAIGLTGFKEASQIVESQTANPAFNEALKLTTRSLEGGVNKTAAFLGSQAGVMGGFVGLDAIKGDLRFNPDYWLTQAATVLPFGIPEAYHTFRPGAVPIKVTSGKPYKIEQPLLGPKSLRDITEDKFFKEYIAAPDEQKNAIVRQYGFDTVIKHAIVTKQRELEKGLSDTLKSVDFTVEKQFEQQPDLQVEYQKAKQTWDALQKTIRTPGIPVEQKEIIKQKLTKSQFPTASEDVYKALVKRDRLKAGYKRKYRRLISENKSPELGLIELAQMSVLADNDLRLFGLNNHKLISQQKGERSFSDYRKVLEPQGWKPREVRELFISHLKDAKLTGEKISDENIKKFKLDEQPWFTGEFKQPEAKPSATPHPDVIAPEPAVKPVDPTVAPAAVEPVVVNEPAELSELDVQVEKNKVEAPGKNELHPETDDLLKQIDAKEQERAAQSVVTPETVDAPTRKETLLAEQEQLAKELGLLQKQAINSIQRDANVFGSGAFPIYMKMLPKLIRYGKNFIELKLGDLVAHLREQFGLSAWQAENVRDHAEKMQQAEYEAKPQLKEREDLLNHAVKLVDKYGGISDHAADISKVLNRAKEHEIKYGLAPKADQFRRAIDSRLQDIKGEYNTASVADRDLAYVLFEMRELGDTPNDTISRIKAISRLMNFGSERKGGRPEGYDEIQAERQGKFEREIREIQLKIKHELPITRLEKGKLEAYRVLQNYMSYPQYAMLQNLLIEGTQIPAGKEAVAKEHTKIFGNKDHPQGPKHPGEYTGKSTSFEPKYSVLTSRLFEAMMNYAENRVVLKADESKTGGGKATAKKQTASRETNRKKFLAEAKAIQEKYDSPEFDGLRDEAPYLLQDLINASLTEVKTKFELADAEKQGITLASTVEKTSDEELASKIREDLSPWFGWITTKHFQPEKNSSDLAETKAAMYEVLSNAVAKNQATHRGLEGETNVIGEQIDPVAAASANPDDPLLVAVMKDIVRNEDFSLGAFPAIENYLYRQLFTREGQMRPFEKIPKFYQDFLIEKPLGDKVEIGKAFEPAYEINTKKFADLFLSKKGGEKAFLEQRTRYLDEMIKERKVNSFLARDQLLQERESSKLDPSGQPIKFTMLDKLLNTIRAHPQFRKEINNIREAFLTKKLSPEEVINIARYVETRPPSNIELKYRAKTEDGKTVPEVVDQRFKDMESRSKYVDKLENSRGLIQTVADKFGLTREVVKSNPAQQIRFDNLRVEILNYLWENPDKGAHLVIRPGMGRPVDPVRLVDEQNAFTELVDSSEKGIDISTEVPPQVELPGETYPPTGVEFPPRVFEGGMIRPGDKGADQPSAWTQSYLTRNELRDSPLGQLNDRIVRSIDSLKRNKKLDGFKETFKGIFDKYVQADKPIPVELQGGLRLIAETYGKKWESELLDTYNQATRLNVEAAKHEEDAAKLDNRQTPVDPTVIQLVKDALSKKLVAVEEANIKLNKLLGDPEASSSLLQKARDKIKAAELELSVAEHSLDDLMMHGERAQKEQVRLRGSAEFKRNEALALLEQVKPLQAKFDKIQGFAPGFRGAEQHDTDFLNFRPRADRPQTPALEVHPESQSILDQLSEFTDGISGNSEETQSLAFKMQDEGFVGSVVPSTEMGDLWIGHNDLKGVQDAVEGGRFVGYFAKPEEVSQLRKLGLKESVNGKDHLFHSEIPEVLDSLAKPRDLFQKALERLGETNTEPALRALESITRLYSNASSVRFFDITRGSDRSGFTNVKGKVQKIWQQIPESWHGFSKGEKVRAYLFTLAHEMSHGLEFEKNAGTLSKEGKKIYSDVRTWAMEQDPSHLADMLDIMVQKNLPKDWRDNPAIKEVLRTVDAKGDPRAVEEFMTNVDAIMQLGFLEHNNADFRDSMRLMPVPVRNMWQWFMRGLQNFARAGRALFKEQARKDSQWIVDKLGQLRKESNKAEKDFEDANFFADLQGEKLSERMGMIVDDLNDGIGVKKWEPLFRGAEDVEPGNTSSGAVTSGTRWMNRFMRLFPRLEHEGLTSEPQARVLSAMLSVGHWAKKSTQEVLGKLYGNEAGVDMLGNTTRPSREYEAYMKNELFKRIGNLIRDWTIQGDNVSKPKFIDGKFQEDMIFPTGSEGRRLWNNLSAEQKGAVIKHEAGIQNAIEMQKVKNLEGRELHFKALMAHTLGAKEQGMHRRAYDLSTRLYNVLKGLKSKESDVAMKAMQDYKSLEGEFDNAVLMKAMTQQGQEFIRMNEQLKEFYDSRPSYENIQQFSKYVTTMVDKNNQKEILHAGSAEDMQAKIKEAKSRGLEVLHEKTPNDRVRVSDVDTKLYDLMTKHHQRAVDMVESGLLGSFDESTKQGLIEAIGEATTFDKLAREKAAKTNYLPGTNRKGHKGFEDLDRTAQLFNYVSTSNSGLSKAATKALALHELNAPELKNNLELKTRLKQQLDQYLSKDSDFGNFVTKWMAVTHLGLNFPSHIVELTQPIAMAIPALQRLGHTWMDAFNIHSKAQGAVASLYKNRAVEKLKFGINKTRPEIKTGNQAYDDLLTRAAARDEIDVNSLREVREQQKEAEAYSKLMNGEKPEGKISKALNAYADFSMYLYHFFPRHNNFLGHIMGYESAIKRINPDTGKKFTHDEAVEEAIRFNRATMFTAGRAGRQAAPYANKTIGQTMMTLQSFSTGWIGGLVKYFDEGFSKERYPNLSKEERSSAKKAAIGMLGTSIFFSGLVGAPFAGAMMKVMGDLLGEDLEAEARKNLQELTKEPAFVDMVMEGAANTFLDGAGIPIDLSSKMGIGGAFGFNPITGYSAASLLGPTASLLNRAYESIKPFAEGDIAKAISIGGPSGVRKLAELIANEGEFRSYDGSPLFDENDKPQPVSKALYALGFGNQDVKKARTNDRLENSVRHYENEKASKTITEIAGLVKDKSWLAQQKLMEYVNSEVTESKGYENMNSVQQQIKYRQKYSEAVGQVAKKVSDLTLPVDPRREVSDRSARTMTALMSGVKAQMPPSSVLTRMALRDAVYQKMGIAPPETSRREYAKAFVMDQIQNQHPGWTMPQVKNHVVGF